MSDRIISSIINLDLDKDYNPIINKMDTSLFFFKWNYGSMFLVDGHEDKNLKFIKFNEIAIKLHGMMYRFFDEYHNIEIYHDKNWILNSFNEYTSLERILALGRDITDDNILGTYINRKKSIISDLEYIIGSSYV